MDGPAKTTGLLQTLLLILCLCVVINRAQGQTYTVYPGQYNNYNSQQHAPPTNNNRYDQQNASPNIPLANPKSQNLQPGVWRPNTHETNYNQDSYQQGTQQNRNSGIGGSNQYRNTIPNKPHNYDQAGETQFGPIVQPQRHICRFQRANYDCIFRDVIVEYGNVEHLFGIQGYANLQRNITFSESRMNYLPKSLMDAFPNMVTLNAESLQIRSIQPQAFEKAGNLQNLYLSKNLIDRIKPNTFRGASKIITLVLDQNKIKYINNKIFEGMHNLKHAIFSFNQIPILPSFTNNPSLEVVNASHNSIRQLDNNLFDYNLQLRILDLSFNQLNNFFINSYLEWVDVSSNQLQLLVIPTHVKTLIARNNSIENLSTNNQCSVQELYLTRNLLKEQPDLNKCFYLRYLDLSFNQLDSFNFITLQNMYQLTHVILKHNRLLQIELPVQFNYPLPIQYLDLSSNMLSTASNTQALRNLFELYLHSNKFTSFDFLNTPNLQQLTLAFNQWDCAVLKNVNIRIVLDRQRKECTTGFHYEGICCQSNEEPESQNLQKNMEKLRETLIHEQQNKKSVDDQCRSAFLHSINRQKIQEINNKLENITSLETSKEPLRQEILNVNRQIDQVVSEIGSLQEEKGAKNNQTKSLEKEIDRWRANYGIEKEGLVSGETVLKRIVNFLEGRKNVTDDVLMRRQNEVRLQETERQTKLNLIETTKQDIESLKQTLKKLKEDEQNAKMERNSLAAQVNKNSPSQRG